MDNAWDVVYLTGYVHLNNWRIAKLGRQNRARVLYHSDSNFIAEQKKPAWRKLLKRLLLKQFFSKVSIFLAIGDNNLRYLKYYGAPTHAIRFCPIPVDIDRFKQATASANDSKRRALRQMLGLEEQDHVVGFCGKLIPRKRPMDLIAALKHPALSAQKIVGLFIGDGMLEAELRLAAGAKARFSGFINQSDIPDYLSLCDVVAMPSEYDPHPIVVTEAQSLEKPVLLSDQCGCHGPNDVFRDGESGLLYPCGNVAKLAESIAKILQQDDLRHRMGKRAGQLADQHSARAAAAAFLDAARADVLPSPDDELRKTN